MPALNPTPDTLGLASPALGPWFRHDSATLPVLALPNADLSVTVPLVVDMEWRAPAGGTRSYAVATSTRPAILQTLRDANGDAAFSDDSLVVLHTLLPEVELRLWTLTQVVPQPDGSALTAANTPSRLRIRSFALEIPDPPTDMNNLRETDLASEFDTDAKRAEFLGLSLAGTLGNGTPVTELCRPDHDSAILVQNRTGIPLNSARLWCFDHRGRAVDPGAVASMWSFMSDPANAAVWTNLATETDASLSRTAATAAGRIAHLVSPSEGPLDSAIAARLATSGLTAIDSSNSLFTIGTSPGLQLSTAPATDLVPIPRMAPLPNGPYVPVPVAPVAASGALFSGWTTASPVFALARDYLRIAMLDVESLAVGAGRDDSAQANPMTRLAPLQNSAGNPVLLSMDAMAGAVMTTLAGGAATAMAPVMDTHGGASSPVASGSAVLPLRLEYEVFPLAGEGSVSGDTSEGQTVLIDVRTPDVSSDGWVRLYTHARDELTGKRKRLDGGAAAFDGAGLARVIVPIPDGTSGPTDPGGDPVFISFDAMVISGGSSAMFMDQRVIRPAVAGGSRLDASALDGSESLFVCERAATFTTGSASWQPGDHVMVVSGDPDTTPHALLDTQTLAAADRIAATLSNAAMADDTLITTSPAFTDTPAGTLAEVGGTATRVHRARSHLTDPGTLGAAAPSMERFELVANDAANLIATVGAGELREHYHEAAPPRLAHAGLPAAPEIGSLGLSLAGPAATALIPLMDERRSTGLGEYLTAVSTPMPVAPAVTGTTQWSAVLETIAHGVTGDAIVRAYVTAAMASHTPGQSWVDLKNAIEAATGQNLDPLIDTATFDDDAAAAGVDRLIRKTADGVNEFARAVTTAIERAEDFVYIQTPCIDNDVDGDDLDWIQAIRNRWAERPGLCVMLIVPENFLPDRPDRLKDIRKAGINAALKELADANASRLAWVTPIAGPGRPWHLAASAIVVDDVWMALGSTHFWRRGLTFDSSLAATLFDENVTMGRPTAVRATRLQLLANSLGLAVNLVPDDPEDCLEALQQLASGSGLGRIKPNIFSPAANDRDLLERSIWNPDGRPGAFSTWFGFFNDLIDSGDAAGISDAIR
ncbi:hypothetical protein ACUNV4_11785 [Granulosicoccus sp. 3-233]|uniref:hypothetical protein n=1 Tax=Granulosicoccus sp. 3-233 TaxID=3417969 RepID=UPI003D34C41C